MIHFLIEKRRWVFAAIVALTVAALPSAAKVGFESSIDIWFLEDDESLLRYRSMQSSFGGDEVVVLAVFADDVFAPEVVARIDAMTRAADALEITSDVRSIAKIRYAQLVNEAVEVGPLIDELPQTAAEAEVIRRRAHASELLDGLFTTDDRATAIVVELDPDRGDFEGKAELVSALRAIVADHAGELDVRLTGTPVFDDTLFRYSNRDFAIYAPLALLLIFGLGAWVFGSRRLALVPLVIVAVSLIWLFAVMGDLGIQINAVSATLSSLVLAIGVADAVHLISDYLERLLAGRGRRAAIAEALRGLWLPCLFTSTTTIAGLLSLRLSEIGPIREFGTMGAVGVAVAFAVSMTLGPAMLAALKPPPPARLARLRGARISRLLSWMSRGTRKRDRVVVAIALLATAALTAPIAALEVGVNPLSYFKADAPIRVDTEAVEQTLGGTVSLELVVRGDGEIMKDPALLADLAALERSAEADDSISHGISAVDSLVEMGRLWTGGSPGSGAVPDTRAKAAQLYLTLESEDDFTRLTGVDYASGRVTLRSTLSRTDELRRAAAELEVGAAALAETHEVRAEVTGYVHLMSQMYDYLLDSQIRTLSLAFLVITIMLGLLLRSARLALFALIPNIAPIAVGLGLMGLLDIRLDIATVMIGSIALGLVVDDTVHFLTRVARQRRAGMPLDDAIAASIAEGGRGIVVTSAVLAGGFGILAIGSFVPNIHFGLLSVAIIGTALVADLVVLPAALRLTGANR